MQGAQGAAHVPEATPPGSRGECAMGSDVMGGPDRDDPAGEPVAGDDLDDAAGEPVEGLDLDDRATEVMEEDDAGGSGVLPGSDEGAPGDDVMGD